MAPSQFEVKTKNLGAKSGLVLITRIRTASVYQELARVADSKLFMVSDGRR